MFWFHLDFIAVILLGFFLALSFSNLIFMIPFFILVFWIAGPVLMGAPWTTVSIKTARRMLEFARTKPGDKVYDLGSGDGRIPIIAAKEFDAKATGIEIDPIRVAWSKLAAKAYGVEKKTKFIQGDLFNTNLRKADVVTVFLLQETNQKLKKKLKKELKKGARVVSYAFTFDGWRLKKKDVKSGIYLYGI